MTSTAAYPTTLFVIRLSQIKSKGAKKANFNDEKNNNKSTVKKVALFPVLQNGKTLSSNSSTYNNHVLLLQNLTYKCNI